MKLQKKLLDSCLRPTTKPQNARFSESEGILSPHKRILAGVDPKTYEDPLYRKSRLAARLLIKAHKGRPLKPSEKKLAAELAREPGVTSRLIGQALTALNYPRRRELANQIEF